MGRDCRKPAVFKKEFLPIALIKKILYESKIIEKYLINRKQKPAMKTLRVSIVLIWSLTVAGYAFAQTGRININRADARELMELPYIGERRAMAIVESRRRSGPFSSISDLVERKIIGRETLDAIQHRVSLHSGNPSKENFRPVNITNIHINGLAGDVFLLENRNYNHVLSSRIDRARHSIRIMMYLFKTSENRYNYATRLLEQLIQAEERGVDVEVIAELSDYNLTLNESNQYTLKRLKSHGITVRTDSPERQTHTKLVIIDEIFTFIGSHNFSHSALGLNNELSLMIESKEVAEKSLDYFRSIREECTIPPP